MSSCYKIYMNNKGKEKEMEWSNLGNMRGSFMPPPWLESNSSNSLHTFNYDLYSAGNSYATVNTQAGPVISVPESENMINGYNNIEMKKRKTKRLTSEQLVSLEKSFQQDIKLDSDRKLKLSKELGLQQRQIAVWFQNRRARLKVKHLEDSYDSLKQEYDVVARENHMLHDEVKKLRGIILKDQLLKRQANLNNNQIVGSDHQYNNSMFVAPTFWLPISQPPYPC